MCTSFAVYKDKPIYAMNFDCWDVESRFRIDDHGSASTFFFEVNLEGEFVETAGMNTHGFFGNFQGNLSDKHKNIVPDSNCIAIDKLYRQFLNSGQFVEEMSAILNNKTVVYNPVPPEYNMLHNMFADKSGNAIILETADGRNDITRIKDDFLVMTNFPIGQFKNTNYKDVCGAGNERYIAAYEYISNINANFGIDNAFEILKNTAQKEKNWETLISIVFVPEESAVYIALKREFQRIWKIDINRKCIEGFRGFKDNINMSVDNTGLYIANLPNS